MAESMVEGPELFLGFVGAVGTDLKRVEGLVSQELRRVGYSETHLRLSEFLLDCYANRELRQRTGAPEDERIADLMNAGDALRRVSRRGDAVAMLAMGKVRQIRLTQGGGRPLKRHAFLLHSLKHPDEIYTLREAYGGAFVSISVYTPKNARLKTLCDRIAKSRQAYDPSQFENVSQQLIDTDEKEGGDNFGQNVRDTFPEADVFLDATDPDDLPRQVTRLIEILFRHPYRTPTIDEYGLFHARAAALRSADLSRQVGAVIATGDGEIIAAGCNEVPKAGGGSVWEGRFEDRARDRRDFMIGYDSSTRLKHEIFEEIFDRLRRMGWLEASVASLKAPELVDRAIMSSSAVLSGTRAASIIEFGRIVHAEMSAITDAARRGLSVKDSTLYCTTFPCHVCARHIIASGIKRVVYIEPYPKSMARGLYMGALDVDHDPDADQDAVAFRPFVGISPRRYMEFFEMPRRKDNRGHVVEWRPDVAVPRVKQYPTYLDVEAVHVEQLAEHKLAWGLIGPATLKEDTADE